jgi:cardiolipin synthase
MAMLLDNLWTVASALALFAISVVASAHAVLHKREVHASISWAALIWLAPGLGALAYVLLGRNRIKRRAAELRSGAVRVRSRSDVRPISPIEVDALLGGDAPQLSELARLIEEATGRPLLPGNRIAPLVNGDEAYPEMLAAIERAQSTVALSTYIFDTSPVAMRFVEALAQAQARGVQVRVLIDDVGAHYSMPAVDRTLRRRGVPVARFMPASRAAYFNLRSHRKLLVIDGQLGFTGGMNLRAGHVLRDAPRSPIQDLAFRIEGPVVAQLLEVFAEDWQFTTREQLGAERWFPPLLERGSSLARGIPDGPDEDLDMIRWAFLGGIACARRSIRVLTPYFLPDMSIATALNVAAMRGVQVDIAVPHRGNLPLVQWAMWGNFRKVLGHGCRVWLTPPPFDHSKLLVVDDRWLLFGSPNWDPRSLRLNFELGVECYDPALAHAMGNLIDERIARSTLVTQADLDRLSLARRLRDGVARLLTPYL